MGRRDRRLILASDWIENYHLDEAEPMDPDFKDYVASIVDKLPEEYRLIVEAIAYERLTYREAADRLGYRAHSQVFYKFEKALEMMEGLMEDPYDDED